MAKYTHDFIERVILGPLGLVPVQQHLNWAQYNWTGDQVAVAPSSSIRWLMYLFAEVVLGSL